MRLWQSKQSIYKNEVRRLLTVKGNHHNCDSIFQRLGISPLINIDEILEDESCLESELTGQSHLKYQETTAKPFEELASLSDINVDKVVSRNTLPANMLTNHNTSVMNNQQETEEL